MTSTAPLSTGISFLAGLVSFVSPCVLPLVPAYLSLLTGESVENLRENRHYRWRAIPHAVAFIVGFTIVFVVLFGLPTYWIGAALGENRTLLTEIGGAIVIVLGLWMMGMLRIDFLMRDTRVHLQQRKRSLWTSLVVGLAFAAGWTPCIGPILAGIIALGLQQRNAGEAVFLLLFYSLGLALPFLVVAAAIDVVLPLLARMRPALRAIEFASGAFLVVVGVVLINDAFLRIAGWFYRLVPAPKL